MRYSSYSFLSRSAGGCFVALWLTVAALWNPADAASRSTPAATESTTATVLDDHRLKHADTLWLGSGDRLTGTVLNASFAIRTPYSQVELEATVLDSIDLTDRRQRLESISTINGDRLTGFLDPESIRFQMETGDAITIRKELIRKVVFRLRPPTKEAPVPTQVARLFNGDRLVGQWRLDPLPLITSFGRLDIALGEVESMTWLPDQVSAVLVQLENGDILRGRFGVEDAEIQLGLGPVVRLHASHLESLDCRPNTDSAEASTPSSLPLSIASFRPSVASFNYRARPGMAWIPPGRFLMGSASAEADRDSDEGPQTQVVIPEGFWMALCETRQGEYEQLMGANPSHFIGDDERPVEKVSWHDAVLYCQKRTAQEEQAGTLPPGHVYRLPTEAEWEYACRAGSTGRFSFGDDPSYLQLADSAWFTANSESSTHPVGRQRPNAWGLFDMHGNVWEWCFDRWAGSLPGGTITNTLAAEEGSLRVARGGSWLYDGRFCRTANRDDYSPGNRCSDLGFRVVLAPLPENANGEESTANGR